MFTIKIKTDNAAFEGLDKSWEIGHILDKLAARIITTGETSGNLLDSNGNTVGEYKDGAQ